MCKLDREARKQRIEAHIAEWQKKLRLQDWWIYFAEDEEPADGALGDAETEVAGFCSTLRLSGRLLEHEEEVTVVHELLEVLFKRLRSYEADSKDANVEKHKVIQALLWALLGMHDFEPTKFVVRRDV